MTFTEPLQLTMLEHERKALESYKDITGSSYNFIIEQSIKYYIANKPQITAPAAPKTASKVRKRLAVRLTKETDHLLKQYCEKNKVKISPTVVKAAMAYILKTL